MANIYKVMASLVATGTSFLRLRSLATLVLFSRFVEGKGESVATALNELVG